MDDNCWVVRLTLTCSIPVGAKADQPRKKMRELAEEQAMGWVAIWPKTYVCRDCGCVWEANIMASGSYDVASVSCSACYSDAVSLTEMTAEVLVWEKEEGE